MKKICIPEHLMHHLTDDHDRVTFVEDCEHLLREVGVEYLDPIFGERLHFSDATYMDGCRGALCVAAHRIASRKRTGAEPNAYWAEMEPVLQFIGEQFKVGLQENLSELRRLYSGAATIEVPPDYTPSEACATH